MGLSIAYSVAKRGIKVTLIDASSPDTVRSSRGDSRGLQYGYEGIYSDLVNESADLWEKLEREDPSNRQVSVTVSAYVYVFVSISVSVSVSVCAQTFLFLFCSDVSISVYVSSGWPLFLFCFCSTRKTTCNTHIRRFCVFSSFLFSFCFLCVLFLF